MGARQRGTRLKNYMSTTRTLAIDPASAIARRRALLFELWRYYSAGLINTAFGFTVYVILVRLGLNLFVAQVVSHVMGAAFNYFMFRLHVFRGTKPNLGRYIASYGFNYLISVAILAVVNHYVAPFYDPRVLTLIGHLGGGIPRQAASYVSGVITIVTSSVVNYFVLKRFVFRAAPGSDR